MKKIELVKGAAGILNEHGQLEEELLVVEISNKGQLFCYMDEDSSVPRIVLTAALVKEICKAMKK